MKPETNISFTSFRDSLDSANDRRELLIKASRDITSAAKKIIFLLHRHATSDSNTSADATDDGPRRAAEIARPKLKEVQAMFAAASKAANLVEKGQEDYWRHQRALSPGIQEYIEALSFSYYLEHGKLVEFNAVQRSLASPDGDPYVILTVDDYLLGISDLTGECMRYAIAAAPQRGGRIRAKQVCTFVRSCGADIEAFVPRVNSPRDLRRKQNVTAASLEKIEGGKSPVIFKEDNKLMGDAAVYAIQIRTAEYDLPPELLDDLVAMYVSGAYSSGNNSGDGRRGQDDHDFE